MSDPHTALLTHEMCLHTPLVSSISTPAGVCGWSLCSVHLQLQAAINLSAWHWGHSCASDAVSMPCRSGKHYSLCASLPRLLF